MSHSLILWLLVFKPKCAQESLTGCLIRSILDDKSKASNHGYKNAILYCSLAMKKLLEEITERAREIVKERQCKCCCFFTCTCSPILSLNVLGPIWLLVCVCQLGNQDKWSDGLAVSLAFLNYWYFYIRRQNEGFRQERLFFSHFLKMTQWQSSD